MWKQCGKGEQERRWSGNRVRKEEGVDCIKEGKEIVTENTSVLPVFRNFEYEDQRVRIVTKDGEPWFVLADVCQVLTLGSPHKVADRLEDDEKGRNLIPTLGGEQEMTIISEPGLYSVLVRSNKPEAKPFRRWVTHEVLPQIRKTNMYIGPGTNYKVLLRDENFVISALETIHELQTENKDLQTAVVAQQVQIQEMAPKVSYYDIVLRSPDSVKVTEIAKDYGMSAIAMNKLLHKLGIQYKQGHQWFLYQKYASYGYTQTQTYVFKHKDGSVGTKIHTCYTQKGRLFLYEQLKVAGYLPLIEREDSEKEVVSFEKEKGK